MVGTTFYQSKTGMHYRDFIDKYKQELKGQHGIYVVQTNLLQDLRNPALEGKTIVKVGRSQGTFGARLADYASAAGSSPINRRDQGGVRVLYIKFLPKAKVGFQGTPLTVTYERQLLQFLKAKYGTIKDRGDERFAVDIDELFEIINNFSVDVSQDEDEFVRRSERLNTGVNLMWLVKDLNTGKLKIEFHKDFDTLIQEYRNQVKDKLTKITQGWVKGPVLQKLDETLKQRQQIGVASDLYTSSRMGNNIFDDTRSMQTGNDIGFLYGQISNPWANDEYGADNQEGTIELSYRSSSSSGSSWGSGGNIEPPLITAAQLASRRGTIFGNPAYSP